MVGDMYVASRSCTPLNFSFSGISQCACMCACMCGCALHGTCAQCMVIHVRRPPPYPRPPATPFCCAHVHLQHTRQPSDDPSLASPSTAVASPGIASSAANRRHSTMTSNHIPPGAGAAGTPGTPGAHLQSPLSGNTSPGAHARRAGGWALLILQLGVLGCCPWGANNFMRGQASLSTLSEIRPPVVVACEPRVNVLVFGSYPP